MQQFRKAMRGPVGQIALALIVIPFVITGFYGYFQSTGSSSDTVAKVNGNPVSGRLVSERVNQMRAQVRSRSPEMDPRFIESFISPQMVLDGLITNALLADETERAGLQGSEVQAAQLIVNWHEVQVDGRFDPALFERFVRMQGMTQQMFIGELRRDLVMNQLRAAIETSNFALPEEVAAQRRLAEQTRAVRYTVKPLSALAEDQQVSDEEAELYYNQHSQQFLSPERVQLEYVEFDPASVSADEAITEEQILEAFEIRLAQARAAPDSERRQVAQILAYVDSEQTAEQALAILEEAAAQLAAGADFAEVAASHSQEMATSRRGGVIGRVGKGDLAPALDTAVFTLADGEVSQPVRSEEGYHLLKVLETERAPLPVLEDLREQLIAELEQQRLHQRLESVMETLEELAFNHSDLSAISEQLALPVQISPWLASNGREGLLANDAVRAAVASEEVREQGHNSPVITVGDKLLVLRLADIDEPKQRPLEDVKPGILSALRHQKAQQQAAELEVAARAAGSLESIAADWATAVSEKTVSRTASEPSLEAVREFFAASRHDTDGVTVKRLNNGDLLALTLVTVNDGATELSALEQRLHCP